jgi:hypothetical protein
MQEEICMDGRNPLHLVLAGIFVVITLQIGGFVLLWSKGTPLPEYVYLPATADKIAVDSSANTHVVVASPPNEKALREIIQTVLKQELAPYAHQLTAIPEVDSQGVKEDSPENVEAFTKATTILSAAIARRKLTTADISELGIYSRRLTQEQRIKIMNDLSAAINRQEVVLQAVMPAS